MKKIITIVALSIIGVLIATTITLGFVNSNFKQINVDDAISVTVYKDNSTNVYYKTDGGEYNDLTDLYNKQSVQSVLVSLFTGAYSVDASVENESLTISNKVSSGYWLVYRFDDAQVLSIDGKEYEDKTQTSTQVTFTKFALEVTETNGMELVTIYIYSISYPTQTSHTVSVYADTSEIYNYINDLTII